MANSFADFLLEFFDLGFPKCLIVKRLAPHGTFCPLEEAVAPVLDLSNRQTVLTCQLGWGGIAAQDFRYQSDAFPSIASHRNILVDLCLTPIFVVSGVLTVVRISMASVYNFIDVIYLP